LACRNQMTQSGLTRIYLAANVSIAQFSSAQWFREFRLQAFERKAHEAVREFVQICGSPRTPAPILHHRSSQPGQGVSVVQMPLSDLLAQAEGRRRFKLTLPCFRKHESDQSCDTPLTSVGVIGACWVAVSPKGALFQPRPIRAHGSAGSQPTRLP
jgi:hypothetical protein